MDTLLEIVENAAAQYGDRSALGIRQNDGAIKVKRNEVRAWARGERDISAGSPGADTGAGVPGAG